jgi:phage terminase small subunit
MRKFEEQRARFIDEYLVDFNGKQACIRAGYAAKHAARQAVRLLEMPDIQNALTIKKKQISSKLEISQQRTLLEIGRIAFSDIRKYFNEEGQLRKPSELDDDASAVVSAVESEELTADNMHIGFTKKIKLWDKNRALEMLAKHYGLLGDEDKNDMKFHVTIKKAGADNGKPGVPR